MWKFFTLMLINAPSVFLQETDECKCVIYYLCDRETGEIINDGTGLVTERLGGCDCSCSELNEVCCRFKTNKTSSTKAPPCGYSNPDGVGYRISANSEEVNFGEFPWMIDILDSNGAFICGGSLIHPSVVLTAAHCVSRKKGYIARAGEWDSSVTNEILKHQDIPVGSVKISRRYRPWIPYYDIALLFLNDSFVLTSHIQPICLPPLNTAFGNERCYVAGREKDQSGQYKAVAKKIDLPLIDRDSCQSTLRLQRALGQNFSLYECSLCAGGEQGKDACLGDGGAPLFCPIAGETNRYQQVGIVSWDVGCRSAIPAVYTNVPVFRLWIDGYLKNRNLETKQYEI